jgi:hypothetical protein
LEKCSSPCGEKQNLCQFYLGEKYKKGERNGVKCERKKKKEVR